MKGNPQVIEYLNKALTSELTAVNQYWLHYRLLDDWGFTKLAKKEREESIEEMHHADKLVTRIIFLEGFPNMQHLDPLMIGQNIKEILECDLKAEYWRPRALHGGARLLPEGRGLRDDGSVRGAARRRGRPHQLSRDAAQSLERHRHPELRPAQRAFRRRRARGGRLSLALPLDGPRLAAGGGRRAAPARRVPARLWRRRQRPDRARAANGRARLPHAAFVSPHAPEPCGMAPMGRQWFNLTFRDPGELVRGVSHAAPGARCLSRCRAEAAQSPAARAGARRLQPGHDAGARRRAEARSLRRRRSSAIPARSPRVEALPSDPGTAPAILLVHGDMDEVIPVDAMFIAREQLAAGGACRRVARGGRHRPRHRRAKACVSAARFSSRPSPLRLSSPEASSVAAASICRFFPRTYCRSEIACAASS